MSFFYEFNFIANIHSIQHEHLHMHSHAHTPVAIAYMGVASVNYLFPLSSEACGSRKSHCFPSWLLLLFWYFLVMFGLVLFHVVLLISMH